MSLAARRLDVSENGLDGTIPTYVGDLSDLLYVLTVLPEVAFCKLTRWQGQRLTVHDINLRNKAFVSGLRVPHVGVPVHWWTEQISRFELESVYRNHSE